MSNLEVITNWCKANNYTYIKHEPNHIVLNRNSDNYEFTVNERLLTQIIQDDKRLEGANNEK